VRVVRCDGVVPDLDRARLAELSYSMFATPPREVEGMYPVSRERLHDGDILVVHAPAEMRFDVEAGEHRVTGRYGVKPEAVLDRCTDGVAFAIVSRTRDKKETVVWRRYVDPTDEPADRGYQELDESFTVEEPGTLILRTSVGPKRNGNCDWAFWANIRVE
jgi:hypothetical protein